MSDDIHAKIAKMNALFSAHDKAFLRAKCSHKDCRDLDAAAQRLKGEILSSGFRLSWSESGFATIGGASQ